MKLYKALATAMVATAATMAAMPAGNAAVFYDWRNYNEAGGIYDTHGDRYVPHLRDMNDRVSSIRSYGEHYVAFQRLVFIIQFIELIVQYVDVTYRFVGIVPVIYIDHRQKRQK